MRKRQKPYILIMFVLIAAGGVVFLSLAQPNAGQQPVVDNTPPPATGNKDVQVPDKNEIAKKVAQQSKAPSGGPGNGAPTRPRPMAAEGMPATKSDRPIVMKEQEAPYKPQPNPSSTANQWWTDQSTKTYDPKAAASDATKKIPPVPPSAPAR